MKATTVLIAGDEAIPRLGLKHILDSEPSFTVIGESETEALINEARKLRPDVVVLHVASSRQRVPNLIRSLHEALPRSGIVVLGRETHHTTVGLFFAGGALGYVLLRGTPKDLFSAVRAASRGRRFLDPKLSKEFTDLVLRQGANGPKLLSQREHQVMLMLAQGHSVKEIASRLDLSRKSVETYQARVREKLNLHTRADMVRYALETGILQFRNSEEAS